MKKIFSIAITAVALLSLASCQKETLKSTNGDISVSTERIISGTFTNDATKTTLDTDSITPLWSVGDVIRVLDSTSYQDITLAAGNITDGGKKISFSTTLTGAQLYAVYPASATAMTSCSDGNITFTIPTSQDGTFGSANICVASGDGANNIYFSNATAVVEMSVKSGVVYSQLTAANKIAGNMTVAMGSQGVISSTTTTSLSSKSIFVAGAPTDSKFYMAVAPVDAGTVTATCNTATKSGSIDKGTKTLAMDKIYAMDLSGMTIATDSDLTGLKGVLNGQEYVLIRVRYDGTNYSYIKWGTQNLAVTESGKAKWNGTDYIIGDYFQWAASYAGYGLDGTTGKEKIPANLLIYTSFTTKYTGGSENKFTFKSDKTSAFVIDYAPYYNSGYTKYTSTDTKTTLEQSDDVANIVLGGTWRMPTGGSDGEIKAMHDVTYWAFDNTDLGYYVFKPGVGTSGTAGTKGNIAGTDDKTKALLFFPLAGCGYEYTASPIFGFVGTTGFYWSKTINNNASESAKWYVTSYNLCLNSADASPAGTSYRYRGFSVRPVSD